VRRLNESATLSFVALLRVIDVGCSKRVAVLKLLAEPPSHANEQSTMRCATKCRR